MSTGFFVSGTDTGIGKTRVGCALIRAMRARQIPIVGMKPVASGAYSTSNGLRNEDAEALIAACGYSGDYTDINPHVFAEPIAPHLAVLESSMSISTARIRAAHSRLAMGNRLVLVEGVGGWLAPLGDSLMQSDIVRALDLQVILVVGMRLGCINHALLTSRAIEADGCRLIGWIANRIDPDMLRFEDNRRSIQQRIQAPLLGTVEYAEDPQASNHAGSLDTAIEILTSQARQIHQQE
ncbi:MAG: dethiobiotin synthase [Dokdonella sp.]